MSFRNRYCRTLSLTICLIVVSNSAFADDSFFPLFKREQRRVMYHDPGTLPEASAYGAEYSFDLQPPTLAEPREYRASRPISLDEAIRIALEHVEVVRTLSGNLASTSGRTIYDAAIANTSVDRANAAFDPTLTINNTWSQNENPGGTVDPSTGLISQGNVSETYNTSIDVSKRNAIGGTTRFGFRDTRNYSQPSGLALNPVDAFSTELNYTQPLLRGGGLAANQAPIIIARLDTERSFFQFRGSMQDLVRGAIEAYWNVVAARTELWAREKQIEQATVALERAEARLRLGMSDITEVTQARSALANFKAQKIAADGALLNRESALQNILGLPAASYDRLVPVSPPLEEPISFDWSNTFRLAETRRPDIIELKLIWEADWQRYLQSKNQALPTLNATGLYRWDGLVGRTPTGQQVSTNGSEFTDWQLGINFSVPLFLREERAGLRSSELILSRDRANIKQALHATEHSLALTLRLLEQNYLQYQAFREVRAAAKLNLERQLAANAAGTEVLFLNVLQAISDWGNAVSQEAQALLQYNTTLATIERETGTILETHGIWFAEDQQCSVGPRWLNHRKGKLYPSAHRPTLNDARYPAGEKPSEEFFDLDDYPGHSTDGKKRTSPKEDKKTPVTDSIVPPDAAPTLSTMQQKTADDEESVIPLSEFLRAPLSR